jgi:cytochrome c551/c552
MNSLRHLKLTRLSSGRISGAWILVGLVLGFAVAASLSLLSRSGTAAASADTLSDAQIAHMSSGTLTKYVFDSQGCRTCHTASADGKLGFTERGKQLSKGFEGCTSLLSSMNVIAQVPQASRTPDEKAAAARFQEFGCASCHQIVPGTMGLTKYASKLKSLHLICTEIQCTTCEGEKK